MAFQNSFHSRTRLTAGGETFDIFSLAALERAGYSGIARLPYSSSCAKGLKTEVRRRRRGVACWAMRPS